MAVTAGAGAGRRLLRPTSQAAGATGVPTRPASWGGEERVAPGGAQPKLRNDAAPGPLLGGPRLRGMSRRLQRRRRPAVWGVGAPDSVGTVHQVYSASGSVRSVDFAEFGATCPGPE